MLVLALILATMPPAVDAAITKHFNLDPRSGVAVGIVRDGALDIRTSGLRDVSTNAPVDAGTRFEIGSVTKQFTAAAILQLQEQGKLSIDARLVKYLPSFPHANAVTLRQLLNQDSGLPEYLGMPDVDKLMTTVPDAAPKISAYIASKPLDFTPGTKWQYSNTNYWVLGEVVAHVSGMSWEEYIRTRVFAPAGMTHSGFIGDEQSMSDVATPYWFGPKNDQPTEHAPRLFESWPGGAGAIVSTIGDLAAWNAALTGGNIVSHADYKLMSSPATLADGKPTDYGMGLAVDVHDGHGRISHDGATLGCRSVNAIYPKDRLEIIVLTNTIARDPGVIEAAVLEAMYPDALAAARRPAPGEDLSARQKVLRILGELLNGTLQSRELSPQMQSFLTVQRKGNAKFSSFGAPTAVIFKAKAERPEGTYYLYRVEFAHDDTRNFTIEFDKNSGLIGTLELQPAG